MNKTNANPKENTTTLKPKENLHFNDLFDLAGDAIFLVDIETGNIVDCNRLACENLGYRKEELLALTVGDLDATYISLEDEQKTWNNLKPNKPITIEGKHKRKDGSMFPVEIRISILENNGKKEVLGIARDITEVRKLAIINKDRKLKLKKAQSIANMGFLDWDLTTNKIDLSASVIKMYGLKLKSNIVNPKQVINLVHPNDLEFVQKNLNTAIEEKKPYHIDHRIIKPDGKIIWVQAQGEIIYDENGNKKSFLGTVVDITDRKKAEKIIEEKDDELRSAQKIAQLGFYNYNFKKDILTSSEIFDEIVEFTSKDIKNKELYGSITYPEDLEKLYQYTLSCITNNTKFDIEYRIITKSKKQLKWVHALGKVIYNDNNEPTFFSGTIQDITTQKLVKIELEKAKEKAEESSRLKSEFLHNMSHEIRTPMNGILGFSDLLGNPNLSVEKQHHFVKIIQNSGKLLLRIIDDILEISRLGTKQVKVINEKVCLNNLFVELFSIFDTKAKENKTPLYLKTPLSDENSSIETDISKLHKIISNLLENAIKYTNKGCIELGYYLEKNKLKIYVKDTGIGILPTKLEIIFDRFTQANDHPLNSNASGLGLGLSIAKENAELLGGTLEVTSKTMKGSEFILTLPYKNSSKKSKSAISNNYTEKACNVLIVEDEEVNVLYLETIIHDFADCTVIHAKNGKEAVDIIKQDKTINLILMDLKMPIMNGFEATKEIKKTRPNAIIIAQTAYSTNNEKQKALEAGCTEFISKPLNKEKIKNLLKKFLK